MKLKKILSTTLAALALVSVAAACDNTGEEAPVEEKTVIESTLSNPNATHEARVLYNYILEVYGTGILSGQQESTWINNNPDDEMEYIQETTGKLPAIRGLDYINNDFDGVTQRAIEWWDEGGIVSICWHWGTPPTGVGYESSKMTIDLDEALTEGTELHEGMLKQMDRVAEELLELQEAGVPVLWRPFHEFDGAWFWWGKGGAENFIKLWQLMYDRYTNHHGLNNLIWVLGYTSSVPEGWYPGREYVDVVGADGYAVGILSRAWQLMNMRITDDLPFCYHECGPMPDPEALIEKEVKWVWFLTWHTQHIKEENTPEYTSYIYNHDYVITLDELPDFKAM